MNKLVFKLSTVVFTLAFAMMFMVSGARADNLDCTISQTGSFSTNFCVVRLVNFSISTQQNWADITNVVVASSSTGGNDANNNTEGDTTIESGDATTTVTVVNTVNWNN